MTAQSASLRPRLSLVVPLHDERDNVAPLVSMVRAALGDEPPWELLVVDDGSADGTWEAALGESRADPRVRAFRLAHNYGQSIALQVGFDHARGEVVVTMDGDLQNDAADVPRLVAELESGYDLVVGYRRDRQDDFVSRKVPSWAANRILAWATGIRIRDTGCALKAFRREVLDRFRLYGDLHRFVPALAVATSGARLVEVPVRHHPRRRGRSKYGLSRIGAVLADLLTVKLIRSFRRTPLLYFGLASLAPLGVGGLALAAAIVQESRTVLFGVALLCLSLAIYAWMIGLLAEAVLPERTAASGGAEGAGLLVREVGPVGRGS